MVSDKGRKIQTKAILETGQYPVVDQGKVFIRGYCNDSNMVISVSAPLVLFGDHTRETKFIEFDFVVGADGVKLLQPVCIDPQYYYLALRWLPLESRGYARHFKLLKAAKIPLPPLAEQKRIVAKVDELMVLCDRLEAQQLERKTRHADLARAALTRFADAPIPANLNYLFHPSYTISPADLRKTILSLAVQGILVPQDPEVGKPRMVTMEELVGRKNLKNGLSLSSVDGPSDFVCLPLSAMKGSAIDCTFGKPIAISAERAEPYLIKPRDVFIIRGNGSKERVGIAGMVRECPTNVLFPDLFIRVPLPINKIEADYFLIAWNSPVTRVMLESLATTTAGIWKVNQRHISECAIPLPPLAEQRRIVAKVDQLMALVDELEARLAASRAIAANLLSALVAEITGTTNGRNVATKPAAIATRPADQPIPAGPVTPASPPSSLR
jgi:type I restriction enzyme, S subunit